MRRAAQATGQEIIDELIHNLEQSLEPLRYSVLAPSVLDVHLHPDDYARLQGIFPQLVQEARQALDERLAALQLEAQPSGFRKLLGGSREPVKEYRTVAGGWYISFYENIDPDVAPGDILIDSQLTLPPTQELASGSQTRRIATLKHQGQSAQVQGSSHPALQPARQPADQAAAQPADPPAGPARRAWSSPGQEPQAVQSVASAASPAGPLNRVANSNETGNFRRESEIPTDRWENTSSPALAPVSSAEKAPASAAPEPARRLPQAVLRFEDNVGPQSFTMHQPEIAIGRGGPGHWVDIKLDTLPDISRTHLKIRRDEHGRFFLRDLSAFGCTLNGTKIPSSIERQGDRKLDSHMEVLLPSKARIGLADVLFLDFEVLAP